MKRASFYALILGLLTLSLIFSTVAFCETITLRWAHPSSARSPETVWLKYFSDEVSKRTQGRIKVQVYWGGSLVKLKEMAAAVKNGLADVAWVANSYHPTYGRLNGLYRAATLFALLDDPVEGTSRVLKLWERTPAFYEDYAKTNMVPIVQRYYDLFWIFSNKPGRNLGELKGMRIRSVSDAQQVAFKAIGAAPTFLPASEIYSAMQKGIIDAVAFSPDTANRYKVHEVAKHISRWNLATNWAQWCMNLETWKKLSWLDQMTVIQVGKETSMLIAELMVKERRRVEEIFKKKGLTFSNPTEADRQKWANMSQVTGYTAKWVQELEAAGLPAKSVTKDYLATMSKK